MEQIQTAPSPQRGYMKQVYEFLDQNGPRTRSEIQLGTGLTKKRVDSALRNSVLRGFLVYGKDNKRYAVAPASTYDAKVKNQVQRGIRKTKDHVLHISESDYRYLKNLVEKRAEKGMKNTTLKHAIQLCVLHHKRGSKSKVVETPVYVEREIKKRWWQFWK